MNLFKLLGWKAMEADIRTVSTAAASSAVVRFAHQRTSEFYESESNRVADIAMEWGLSGEWVIAEYAAALADAYADLAKVHDWIEDYKDYLQRTA